MSKNITIQEGGVARTLSGVEKIVTNVAGESGTQNWVPEDEAANYVSTGELNARENGTFISRDDGYVGYSKVEVSVNPDVGELNVSENGTYYAHDDGYDGFSKVVVDVESGGGGGATLITKEITADGTYDASDDDADGYSSVTVNTGSGGTLITKEITANGTYNARDDSADGYSSVTVNVSYPHGRVVVPGINHAKVSQRISTSNFLEDFDEQLFLYLQPKYSSSQSKLLYIEDFVRNGKWWKDKIPEIVNYNNLILVAMGGIGTNLGGQLGDVGIILWTFGIMDETAEITLTNFQYSEGGTSNAFDAYLYDDNKFIQTPVNNGFVLINHRQSQNSDNYVGWKGDQSHSYANGTKGYIDSRTIGTTANMRELLNLRADVITNESGTIRLTNLVGGTI